MDTQAIDGKTKKNELGISKLRNYVNGEWVTPKDCKWRSIENPSTGEMIAEFPLTSSADT
ncbi:MAG: hypothetical protein RBS99_09575 [Rhodospirillales bacterium]|jgi:malonate-semialdehyde dehydrogenase (acetylating)/methylmalonate-semialdehyde dehydrogenase|nr:hypothetical protein [Rhodospirillales bacterium]